MALLSGAQPIFRSVTESTTLSHRLDFGWARFPGVRNFLRQRGRPKRLRCCIGGAGRSVCWPRAGVTMISPGETEAGTAGMQPLPRDNLSLIHISEPTRLGMISYAVFCL